MRLAVVLALVSSLQIFQQSSVDSYGLSIFEYSVIASSFPIGKFAATCSLSIWSVKLHAELDRCAKLLVFGAVIAVIPIIPSFFQSIGRFIMGYSAGSGFVCAPGVLRIAVPTSLRPSNFLYLAVAFSAGTFLANSMYFIKSYISPNVVSSVLAASSGIIYLFLRPNEYPASECPDVEICAIEEEEEIESVNKSCFVVSLMVINATIGVPLMQTYSSLILESFGMDERSSHFVSIIYPIVQLVPLLMTFNTFQTRKVLILGGYLISLFLHFFILITSYYELMPQKHQLIAITILLVLLTGSFVIPCNTGLCILFEQFEGGSVKTASKSRCIMWFLSSIGTLTFGKTLDEYGFSIAFLPYFIISACFYLVLVNVFPCRKQMNI